MFSKEPLGGTSDIHCCPELLYNIDIWVTLFPTSCLFSKQTVLHHIYEHTDYYEMSQIIWITIAI